MSRYSPCRSNSTFRSVRRHLVVWVGALFALGFISVTANANMILTNQYTVGVVSTQLGPDQFRFEYTVTNNTEGIPNTTTGLWCNFLIQLPTGASISDLVTPSPYSSGYWGCNLLANSMEFWGNAPLADYPVGSGAYMAFTASNVAVGQTAATLTTYWAGYVPNHEYVTASNGLNYSTFDATITGPVSAPVQTTAVPEPMTMATGLLGVGCLLESLRRRTRQI